MKTESFTAARSSLGYRLALGLIVLVAVAKPILVDTLDPDCFWHLRVARQLLTDGVGPIVDHLSFNSIREPWTPYSWLAELGMLGVWNVAGWRGTVAVHAMMSAGFVLLVAECCRQMQGMVREREHTHGRAARATDEEIGGKFFAPGELNALLATATACVWSLAYFSFRPATLAIDLLALIAWLILRDRRMDEGSRAIWCVIPIGVVLTNVHLTSILLPFWFGALSAGAMWERFRFSHKQKLGQIDRIARSSRIPVEGRGEVSAQQRDSRSGLARDRLATSSQHDQHGNQTPASLLKTTLTLPSPGIPGEGTTRELARRSQRYTLLACLSAITYLATPMLPGVLHMVGQLQTGDVMVSSSIIGEMRPFYDGVFGKVSLALVCFTLGGCYWNRHRIRSGEWAWLLGMTVFLLRLGRFAPLFAIVAAPMAAAFWPVLSDRPLRRSAVAFALGVLLAIGSIRVIANWPTGSTSLSQWLNRNAAFANGYPTAAADYVDAHVSPSRGRLINEFNWGGYLAWRLGDRYQTFMDGRTQMHPPQFWLDAFFGSADARRGLVDHTDADVAILPKRGSCFHDALQSLGWTTAWQDEQSEVMVPPSNDVVKLDP